MEIVGTSTLMQGFQLGFSIGTGMMLPMVFGIFFLSMVLGPITVILELVNYFIFKKEKDKKYEN